LTMRKIWRIKEPDMDLSRQLASELDMPLLIAQLLVNRGITEAETAQEFLHPDLSNLHPPSKMKGIFDAVARIKKAIADGEKIWIYGDYDVDGITAVSLLMSCLKYLGAEVDYYIPHRLDEGYGLSRDGVADLKGRGCSLIITVDCGIGAVEEVQMANEAGIDVIITDHHEPRDELPPALVTLDPKLADSGYPFDSLSGVGVAFKLAQALMDGRNEVFLRDQFDLVALGTIADVVPLMGENRIIAKYGLEVLNRMERVGIRALCEVSAVTEGSISCGTVGFRLGPRINAAGRIDTAHSAVQLLITDSYEEALEIAQKLDTANRERQSIERDILQRAREQLQKFDLARESGLILAEEGWHPGVIGIVASRLQERYYRPTILISLEGEQGRGSARSIPEFDIFDALTKCSHLLEKFGGHKAAAGLSIAKENIREFRREFSRIVAETLDSEDLRPKVIIDVKTPMAHLSEETVEQLSLLEPHGLGNPRPLLSLTDLSVKSSRIVGKAGEHLQMMVSDGRNSLRTIAFNMADLERELYGRGIRIDSNVRVDLACRPSINVWNDVRSVELRVEDAIVHTADSHEITVASAEVMELSQLKMVDRRSIPDKKRYLQRLLLLGEKALMYVRDDSAVEQFQGIVSRYAPKTRLGLCRSTTSEHERDRMKLMLIQSELDAIASCVPFEEPLSGLRHLVFCHPVPTREDFVRCCAPAVETEEAVSIHLIFNNNDVELLTATLNHQYPDRDTLANVYRKVRELSADRSSDPVLIEEIAEAMDMDGPKELLISNCIAIFEEIDLAEGRQIDGKAAVSLPPAPQERRDLQESQRYANGDRIRGEWVKFSDFILRRTAEDIRRMILETIS
jgi:single-stranded-DNA-specific exonuclease RecJ